MALSDNDHCLLKLNTGGLGPLYLFYMNEELEQVAKKLFELGLYDEAITVIKSAYKK